MLCNSCTRVFRELSILVSNVRDHDCSFDTEQTLSNIFLNRETCSFCARFWIRVRASTRILLTDEDACRLYSSVFEEGLSVAAHSTPGQDTWYINFHLDDGDEEAASGAATSYSFQMVSIIGAPAANISNGLQPARGDGVSISSLQATEEVRKAAFFANLPQIKRWMDRSDAQVFKRLFAQNGSMAGKMPTRLIEIDGDRKGQRLVTTADLDSRQIVYATLSHCWGRRTFQTLRSDNHVSLAQTIPDSMLTLTFRDAIEVCRALGIKYLWIDSLCIIQDSENDWARESSRMHLVYGSSVLNIAATASRNGTEGLFRTLNPALLAPCQIRLGPGFWLEDVAWRHQSRPRQNPLSVVERREITIDRLHSIHRQSLEVSPLMTRGWVVQEIFLAPQTLHFAETQIWWCSKDHGCFSQLSPERPIVSMNDSNLMYSWELLDSFSPGLPSGTKCDPELLAKFWNQIVEDYSRTDFTKRDDRVVALSGMARTFQEMYTSIGLETDYVAGMWRHKLLETLYWVPTGETGHSIITSKKPSVMNEGTEMKTQSEISSIHDDADTTQASKLAPSWSWMSIDGAVDFGSGRRKTRLPIIGTNMRYRASVVSLKMNYLHPFDRFGFMRECPLVLRGSTVPCLIHLTALNDGHISFQEAPGNADSSPRPSVNWKPFDEGFLSPQEPTASIDTLARPSVDWTSFSWPGSPLPQPPNKDWEYSLKPYAAPDPLNTRTRTRLLVLFDTQIPINSFHKCKLLLLGCDQYGIIEHKLSGLILSEEEGHDPPAFRRIGVFTFGVREIGDTWDREFWLGLSHRVDKLRLRQDRMLPLFTEPDCCIVQMMALQNPLSEEITIV